MLPSFHAVRSVSLLGLVALASLSAWGQTYIVPQGSEYSILGPRGGDQTCPSVSLSSSNSYISWEDNGIDRRGAGIGFARLDGALLTGSSFLKVNKVVVSDQIKPQVLRLNDGQFIYVWESRAGGTPDIYARVSRNGTFPRADIRCNSYMRDQQVNPVTTALADGSAIIAWSSLGQDRDMMGIYARKLKANGTSPSKEFQVNQVTSYNQRNPALATLANGNFVVVWVSEQQRSFGSVDVYARIFSPDGTAVTSEIPINSSNLSSSPAVAALPDGGFTVVWNEKARNSQEAVMLGESEMKLDWSVLDDPPQTTNSWDIVGRSFLSTGAPAGESFTINTFQYGDQYRPKIAAGSTGCLVIWTSLGQDASREGVYGRFLLGGKSVAGDEFRVNTSTKGPQLYPTVAWDGTDRFLVVWSTLVLESGFDLKGQIYRVAQ